jgi:hypothetical protein
MPIIPDKKILFIHIPKTGGTYIYWELPGFGYSEDNIFSTTEKGIYSDDVHFHLQHMNYSTILTKGFLTEEYLKPFFKFTFIRNPYTRILSEYFWRLNLNTFDADKFHEFVIDRYLCPKDAHFLSQMFYFDIEYDFIGKYENLIEDLKKIHDILNISHEISPIKRNVSSFNKSELIYMINASTINIINELFDAEFEFGKYEKI